MRFVTFLVIMVSLVTVEPGKFFRFNGQTYMKLKSPANVARAYNCETNKSEEIPDHELADIDLIINK